MDYQYENMHVLGHLTIYWSRVRLDPYSLWHSKHRLRNHPVNSLLTLKVRAMRSHTLNVVANRESHENIFIINKLHTIVFSDDEIIAAPLSPAPRLFHCHYRSTNTAFPTLRLNLPYNFVLNIQFTGKSGHFVQLITSRCQKFIRFMVLCTYSAFLTADRVIKRSKCKFCTCERDRNMTSKLFDLPNLQLDILSRIVSLTF